MALNDRFWKRHFRQVFVAEIHALVAVLEDRLLPTFANVEGEANKKAEEEWERLGSLPGRDDIDMDDLAEKAFEVGLGHYGMMTGLRQGLLNMFAAALFHLYEQQIMSFHRREVLHPAEENDPQLLKPAIFQQRLLHQGIDVKRFACWQLLEELRLLANTVKHAAGESALKLHALRPKLFQAPDLDRLGLHGPLSSARVFAPLMGEDVYVSIGDLKCYAQAVEQFWEELLAVMAQA